MVRAGKSKRLIEERIKPAVITFLAERGLSLSEEKTKKNLKKVYQVVKIGALGIRRFVKIKAAANPYRPEFAQYFWVGRNKKDSKLLPAMSAREFRAMTA
ncbi:hypothetical protein D1BOALGB6SA_8335 [Olavius sp. associated proteobacterium Delta 1]|nr:hypothetical protein D1BOALGB6SA_8335 [Olavius sp. associated proteobacterium Delta 1]